MNFTILHTSCLTQIIATGGNRNSRQVEDQALQQEGEERDQQLEQADSLRVPVWR